MSADQHLQNVGKNSFNMENSFSVLAGTFIGGLILYPIESLKVRIQSSPPFGESQEALKQYASNFKLSPISSGKGLAGSLTSLFIAGTFALAFKVNDVSCAFGITLSAFIRTYFERMRARGQLKLPSINFNSSYIADTGFLAARDLTLFLAALQMNKIFGYEAKNASMIETNKQWFMPVAIATALSQPFDVCLNKSIASKEKIGLGPQFFAKTLASEKLHILTKGLVLRTFINLSFLQVYFLFVKNLKE